MRRLIVVAVSGIAVLVGVAVAVIYVVTAPLAPAPLASSGARPDEPADAPASPEEGAPPLGEAAPLVAVPAGAEPAPDAPEPERLDLPMAPVALALRPLVAPCVPGALPGRHAVARGARSPDPAALVLELVALDGALEVVGAEVASRGALSSEHLACAQRAVKGRRLAVPPGVDLGAGERVRMRYVLP